MNTVVYLVRHGTTDYNTEFKYQGRDDIPLNDLGLAQGALLTDFFKDIPIDAGYTSPLIRARQTLDFALGDRKGKVPVFVEPGIAEIDQGIVEGRTIQEVNILFPAFSDAINYAPGKADAPRGEKAVDVYDRMHRSLLAMAKAHPGKTIVAASHGFAIQTFLNYATGVAAEDMKPCVPDNVAVSRFIYDDDWKLHVDYIGECSHLTEEYRCNYDWDVVERTQCLLLYDSRLANAKARLDKLKNALIKAGRGFAERDIAREPLRREEKEALLLKENGKLILGPVFENGPAPEGEDPLAACIVTRDKVTQEVNQGGEIKDD